MIGTAFRASATQRLYWRSVQVDPAAGRQVLGLMLSPERFTDWCGFLDDWIAANDSLTLSFQPGDDGNPDVVAHERTDVRFHIDAGGPYDLDRAVEVVEDVAWAPDLIDLGRAPVARHVFARVDDGRYLTCLISHHLVHDAHIVDAMVAGIAAGPGARESVLAQCRPFADYVRLEEELVRSPDAAERLRYWETQLADLPVLPFRPPDAPPGPDEPASRVSPPRMRRWSHALPDRIKHYDVLCAASVSAVARHYGVGEVVVTMPWSRRWAEPGYRYAYANLLDWQLLRVPVDPDEPLEDVAVRVNDVRRAARENFLPLGTLVEHLGLRWEDEPNPAMQAMINLAPAIAGPTLFATTPAGHELMPGVATRPLALRSNPLERQGLSVLGTCSDDGEFRWLFGVHRHLVGPSDAEALDAGLDDVLRVHGGEPTDSSGGGP